jgi:ORF6N domain
LRAIPPARAATGRTGGQNRPMAKRALILRGRIERSVHRVRSQNVMIDEDLAELYQVDVKALNQAVKHNRERFPPDFMFRLTKSEARSLRSQIVTANRGRGGRRTAPYAFTEHGVAMLSGVLHSDRAVRVNIVIMRAFVRLRRLLESHDELARKIVELEDKYDGQFRVVFDAIRALMAPTGRAHRRIGF